MERPPGPADRPTRNIVTVSERPRSYRTRSEHETAELAYDVGRRIGPAGATVLLYGDLGAGKTAFVRGLVAAAGGAADDVSSPTFVLMQEYAGDRLVHHVDLYRLPPAEVDDLELHLREMMSGDAIVAIEWADRLARPVPGAIQVWIDDCGADEREITIAFSRASGVTGLDPPRSPVRPKP